MHWPDNLKEWLFLAGCMWVVLFVTGVGIKTTNAIIEWWRK